MSAAAWTLTKLPGGQGGQFVTASTALHAGQPPEAQGFSPAGVAYVAYAQDRHTCSS